MMHVRKCLPILACLAAALAVGTAQAQLIAFYEFDGNANDSSGNGLHATNNGMTYTTGVSGQAVSRDWTTRSSLSVWTTTRRMRLGPSSKKPWTISGQRCLQSCGRWLTMSPGCSRDMPLRTPPY